jgi:hypothetical protein
VAERASRLRQLASHSFSSVRRQDNVTVTDDTRLRAIVPTTKFLLEQGANPILCSHFGRPKGEIIETGKNGRLTPVVAPLEQLLGTSILKVNDCIGPEAEDAASKLTEGQVLLLENTRFHAGETKNDPALSQGLSKLADYFVMVSQVNSTLAVCVCCIRTCCVDVDFLILTALPCSLHRTPLGHRIARIPRRLALPNCPNYRQPAT